VLSFKYTTKCDPQTVPLPAPPTRPARQSRSSLQRYSSIASSALSSSPSHTRTSSPAPGAFDPTVSSDPIISEVSVPGPHYVIPCDASTSQPSSQTSADAGSSHEVLLPVEPSVPRKLRAAELDQRTIYTGPPRKRGRPKKTKVEVPVAKPVSSSARVSAPQARAPSSARTAVVKVEEPAPTAETNTDAATPTAETVLSMLGSIDWQSIDPANLHPFLVSMRSAIVGAATPQADFTSGPGSDATLVPSSPGREPQSDVAQDDDDEIVLLDTGNVDRTAFTRRASNNSRSSLADPRPRTPPSASSSWAPPQGIGELARPPMPRHAASSPTGMLRKRRLSDMLEEARPTYEPAHARKKSVQAHAWPSLPPAPAAPLSKGRTHTSPERNRVPSSSRSTMAPPPSPSPRGPRHRTVSGGAPSALPRRPHTSPNRLRFLAATSPTRRHELAPKSTSPSRPASALVFSWRAADPAAHGRQPVALHPNAARPHAHSAGCRRLADARAHSRRRARRACTGARPRA
jgi:hypothetical protein